MKQKTNGFSGSRIANFSLITITTAVLLLSVAGCDNQMVTNGEELTAFNKAGPVLSEFQNDAEEDSRKFSPYKVNIGDVLEFQMPIVLKDVLNTPNIHEPYMCRVSEDGKVSLPIIGEVQIAGQTLTEVESTISNTYFPQFFKVPPSIVCKVNEHLGERSFTVTGLVKKPGVFPYPTNVRYSLVDALAFSEGVDLVADPHYVKIFRRDSDGGVIAGTFKIDDKSYSVAAGVMIKPGDVVSVQMTDRTRMNLALAQILRLNFGAYYRPEEFN